MAPVGAANVPFRQYYRFQVSGFGCQGVEVLNPHMKLRLAETMNKRERRTFNVDGLVKSLFSVSPANAGVQKLLKLLDSGVRRNDNKLNFRLFTNSSMFDIRLFKVSSKQS